MKPQIQSHGVGVKVSRLHTFTSKHWRGKGGWETGLGKWGRWSQRLAFLQFWGVFSSSPQQALFSFVDGHPFNRLECTDWPFSWETAAPQEVQELRLHLLTVRTQLLLSYQLVPHPGTGPLWLSRPLCPAKDCYSRGNGPLRDSQLSGRCQPRAPLDCGRGSCHRGSLDCPFSRPLCTLPSPFPLSSNASFSSNTQLRHCHLLQAIPEILKQFSFIDSPLWIPKYLLGLVCPTRLRILWKQERCPFHLDVSQTNHHGRCSANE